MNFGEVFQAMVDGKEIYNTNWGNSTWRMFLKDSTVYGYGDNRSRTKEEARIICFNHTYDFSSNTWKVSNRVPFKELKIGAKFNFVGSTAVYEKVEFKGYNVLLRDSLTIIDIDTFVEKV